MSYVLSIKRFPFYPHDYRFLPRSPRPFLFCFLRTMDLSLTSRNESVSCISTTLKVCMSSYTLFVVTKKKILTLHYLSCSEIR